VQIDREAELQLYYAPIDEPTDKNVSPIVTTRAGHAFTATLLAHGLEPGTTYSYEIYMNGEALEVKPPSSKDLDISESQSLTFTTQELWQYRTDPPDFSFLMGSCLYTNDPAYDRPGRPYGQPSDTLFSSMSKLSGDFMLWLGDNIYLRTPDFDSHTGIYHRYTDFKTQPYIQPFWAQMHHYAIWDDHDFGPNNSDRAYIYKDLTRQAFIDFWANPTYGRNNDGIYTEFRWSDCNFLLLDNRFFRTPNGMPGEDVSILGDDQKQWLKDRLISAQGSFVFVAIGGQFLNPSTDYENYANYAREREEIIQFIHDNDLKNIIFLSGDRHRTELSKLAKEGHPTIYDLTCSPLSSQSYAERAPENNHLRVKGTQVADQNFGRIEVSGVMNQRVLQIEVYNTRGEKLWQKTIEAE
jgi:alkaline phosphatase D